MKRNNTDLTPWIVLFLCISSLYCTLRRVEIQNDLERTQKEVSDLKGVIAEQQAYIRNQRERDQAIWDMLNLHSEQLTLLWEE